MSSYVTLILVVLTINIFTFGAYVVYRGWTRKLRLRKLPRVSALIKRGHKSFRGTISWTWRDVRATATKRHLYLLGERERVHIYYSPTTQKVELDIWTNNGTGHIIVGLVVASISVAIGLFLIL